MTDELVLPSPHPPRCPYVNHSHLHTTYTPPHSSHPRSSRSRTLRSFGFFHVTRSHPILGLLLFLPVEPSVCETFRSLRLALSLSLYRHPSICILFISRFSSYNKHHSIIGYHKVITTQTSLSLYRHPSICIVFSLGLVLPLLLPFLLSVIIN